jgi:hypothetical protein
MWRRNNRFVCRLEGDESAVAGLLETDGQAGSNVSGETWRLVSHEVNSLLIILRPLAR